MSGSPFDRPQGNGFSTDSIFQITSNAGGLFADGYVVQKRGSMRAMFISLSGFAVTGTPKVMQVSDGPGGPVIVNIPLYGASTHTSMITIPVELANGVYVSGIGTLGGTNAIEATFVHEVRDPAPADQEQPR